MKQIVGGRTVSLLGTALIALGMSGGIAQAGIISGTTSQSPGSEGTASLTFQAAEGHRTDEGAGTTGAPNVTGFTTFNAYTTHVDSSTIDMEFTVTNFGQTHEYLFSNNVTFPSDTHGYTLILGTGTGGSFVEGGIAGLDFDTDADGDPTSPTPSDGSLPFTLTHTPTRISWSSGSGVSGTNPFTFSIDIPDNGPVLGTYTFTLRQVAATPEPGTMALFGIGLAGLVLSRRRRKKDGTGGEEVRQAVAV